MAGQKGAKKHIRLLSRIMIICFVLMLCSCFQSSAAEIEDVPYYSYSYWEGPNRYKAVPMRHMFEADLELTGDKLGTTPLESAKFITLSKDGDELYIVDSGNSRILIVNTGDFSLISEIKGIQAEGESLSFQGATGIYVNEANELYIADTDHARVLVCTREGKLLHRIEAPSGIGIPTDLDFRPIRITQDRKGYLYVVSEGCYYGMLVFDNNYEYLGFHGSYTVEGNILNTLKSFVTGLFLTNEKNAVSQKKLPAEILDVSVDKQGMLYTLSSTKSGQIKRLGLNGNQTLGYRFGFVSASGDTVDFAERPFSYWHKHFQYTLVFRALTVDEDGFIYALDSGRSRIFMFNEECRVVTAFSTGFSEGDQVGTFVTPMSIACGNDTMYVLDFVRGSVTVFRATEYNKFFKKANLLTIKGEYESALPYWKEVLRLDANSQFAYEGIGKAMLSGKNYNEAMKYARKGNDQQTYSQAFSAVQKDYLSRNFIWIFPLGIVLVGGVIALLMISKKKKLVKITNPKVQAALATTIHPFQSFQSIKYQKHTSIILASLFVLLFYIATVSEHLYGGFMYVLTDTASYNALYTLIETVGIFLLWVIVNWALCILSEGKGSFKEVYTVSAYCLMPKILYSLFFIVGSHLIPATGTSAFSLLGTIVNIFTIILLLISMTVVHEYSFFKAVGMTIATVLGMLLVAFVILSICLLSQQFFVFIISIVNEVMLR